MSAADDEFDLNDFSTKEIQDEIVARFASFKARIAAADALVQTCYIFPSGPVRCTDLIGGTIGTGPVTFNKEMCCLPCRVRTALADEEGS